MRKILIAAVVLGVVGSAYANQGINEQESNYIYSNKEKIKSKLKDPKSAKFGKSFVSRSLGMPIVCGYVNSKNSFGGYSGEQRFVSGGTIQVLEDQMGAGEMDSLWAQACK